MVDRRSMILTQEQIQAQAAAIRNRSAGDSRVLALRHTGGWTGPDRLTVSGEEYRVFPCISDLQIREALGKLEEARLPGILLCSLDPSTLGEDVLARLMKRQIHHPRRDEMLRELFCARVMDARILASSQLVDALIRGASVGGYAPASGGTLDLQFAWKSLLKRLLGFEVSEITFSELLRWTTTANGRTALIGMEPALRDELAKWLSPNCGEAPRFLFRAMESELGSDLVALGLLLGLILVAERSGLADAKAAEARLEQYFGNESPDAATKQTWYQAATELFARLAETEVFQAQGVIQNLDRLVERVRLNQHAHLSDHSRMGLEQRLAEAGESIRKAAETMAEAEVSAARSALDKAGQHRLAPDDALRLKRLQMALRLVLWLRSSNLPGPTASLSQLIAYYQTEGGFMDWARTLVIESDPNPRVKEALRSVVDKVESPWAAFQQKFAERLQQWSAQAAELDGVLRIEEVLAKIVAPVAKQHPVLLIVLDGMSQAVFRELMADLMRRNWVEVSASEAPIPHSVLATIPSITEVSRRALLSGQLPVPAEGNEKSDFAGSERLFEQTGGQFKPQLFLKGDLLESGLIGLSGVVAQAIANSRCRLVGVVVN
ncbi:MAG: BREX-2 system phosphatase PglZ, partial [Verrucomicrobia bacterium]|nr:BREX-2 system phosphatase PglZ [Verrucomicrobiota bacterium]